MPLPAVGLGRSGNVPINRLKDQSRFSCNIYSVSYVKLTTRQVAVKALIVYASDEAMAKKAKVSNRMKIYYARGCHFAENTI